MVARWSHRVGERTDAIVVLCYEEEVFCDARLKMRDERRGGKDRRPGDQESLGLVHVKVASTSRTYYSPLHEEKPLVRETRW